MSWNLKLKVFQKYVKNFVKINWCFDPQDTEWIFPYEGQFEDCDVEDCTTVSQNYQLIITVDWASKFKKVQTKKLVKWNESISQNFILDIFHFNFCLTLPESLNFCGKYSTKYFVKLI